MSVKIAAVIFDMDGLLIDSEPLAKEAWQAAVRVYDAELGTALFDRMLGRRQIECAALVQRELGLPVAPEALCRQRNDLFLQMLPGRVRPMPGACELVRELQARGVRRALATSGERSYVNVVLRELALEAAFDACVVAEDVTRGKPAPEVYLLAAERLAAPPDRCLVLEDAPNGIAAAKAAGCRSVAVPNAFTRDLDLSAADARLPSLLAVARELDALLEIGPIRSGACPPPCADGSCSECQQERRS